MEQKVTNFFGSMRTGTRPVVTKQTLTDFLSDTCDMPVYHQTLYKVEQLDDYFKLSKYVDIKAFFEDELGFSDFPQMDTTPEELAPETIAFLKEYNLPIPDGPIPIKQGDEIISAPSEPHDGTEEQIDPKSPASEPEPAQIAAATAGPKEPAGASTESAASEAPSAFQGSAAPQAQPEPQAAPRARLNMPKTNADPLGDLAYTVIAAANLIAKGGSSLAKKFGIGTGKAERIGLSVFADNTIAAMKSTRQALSRDFSNIEAGLNPNGEPGSDEQLSAYMASTKEKLIDYGNRLEQCSKMAQHPKLDPAKKARLLQEAEQGKSITDALDSSTSDRMKQFKELAEIILESIKKLLERLFRKDKDRDRDSTYADATPAP